MSSPSILIIGAGISGSTLARLFAELGKHVVVIEKREHIAGNCFDYINEDGILVSKYGAHLFHTNDAEVWKFVNQFSRWRRYEHKVVARVDGTLVPVPVNITTVNKIFGLSIRTESEMNEWLEKNQVKNGNPQNGKEAALARVGSVLYEKIFREYTFKQWGKYPEDLAASVLQRIPVRNNFDDRYFSDTYQGIPIGGYRKLFENLLNHENIKLRLNTDFFDIQNEIGSFQKIFYTGPIDRYFNFKQKIGENLEWRSIHFEWRTIDQEFYQPNLVVNYPQKKDGLFTRIVEYKHLSNQKNEKTTICYEYTSDEGEPYYPVPNTKNNEIFEKYKNMAKELKHIYFVGRLANYKYFNMDEAFRNALDIFKKSKDE